MAVDLENHGELPSGATVVQSIEIWRVDDDGQVLCVRAFFDTDPALHDEYYLS